MKMEEIRNLSKEEAEDKLKALRKEAFELKFSKHTGVLEKPHTLKNVKKDIARLLTHINKK